MPPPADAPATDVLPAQPHVEAQPRGYVEMGYLFAAVGALLFSTKAIAIKLAYTEAVDATTLLALRMGFALPFYLAIGAFAFAEAAQTGALPKPGIAVRALLVGLLGYWFASYADFPASSTFPPSSSG